MICQSTMMPSTIVNLLSVLLALLGLCLAQEQGPAAAGASPAAPQDPPSTTIFSHGLPNWLWISGQGNAIFQAHGPFSAKYSGDNSLRNVGESATSRIVTLYTGVRLSHTTEAIFDLEEASGAGLSSSVGLAGYSNLDVVRIPGSGTPLTKAPYIARLMLHQVLPLGDESKEMERGPMGVLTRLPVHRLEFRLGKFPLVDFFDVNSIGSDSHLQFMNWAMVNNAGYDFAADTRGYTWGALLEYQDKTWGVRFAEALMPKVANGIDLDWNLRRARAENLELEVRQGLLPGRAGTVRLLAYVNHANMGSYRQAISAFLAGMDPLPDVTVHRRQGRVKYGFGLNLEQALTRDLRAFGRFGWNEGENENFAYTEVNQTFSWGGDVSGRVWKRSLDKIGLAFTTNAISRDHQRYLALGGHGFLLGDGPRSDGGSALNYGRENIIEGYYTLHLWRGVYTAFDLQHISNPGYNRDRGPVLAPALRLHLEF